MFNIDASILQTTFFTKSWVKYTDLDKDNFYKILNEYLQNLEAQIFEKFYYQEMIIVLCNTLIWLQEFEIAYNLLK